MLEQRANGCRVGLSTFGQRSVQEELISVPLYYVLSQSVGRFYPGLSKWMARHPRKEIFRSHRCLVVYISFHLPIMHRGGGL